jgi:hypothetical protein
MSGVSRVAELERKNGLKSKIFYKLLSFVSGQELAETERQKLREHRRDTLEKHREVGLGSPELVAEHAMDEVIDMGLKEAQLMNNFEPDLLIVTPQQYKVLFDIPASVGIGKLEDPARPRKIDTEPPLIHGTDAGRIEVTYSESAEGMLLVESDEL